MSATLQPTRDVLLNVARKLPPAAQILAGIVELLHDVNTDLDQIADEIRLDAALSSRVIRISNSVVYGGAGNVSTVEEAVGRVGFAEIVRLVGTATVNRIVDQELRCYHVAIDPLREALLMHGLASEALAEQVGLSRNTAYVGGLLRGIGTMVLDRYAGDKLGAHQTYDPAEFSTYREWEVARFGITSTRVTTMALDEWRFPDEIVSAIELHLEPPVEGGETERLANVINLGGTLAMNHGHAMPGEVPFWVLTPEKLAIVGIDEEQFRDVAVRANELFETQRQALY